MNIFAIDSNPRVAAQWHLDKHIIKMPLEHAQCLCTISYHLHDHIYPWLGYKATWNNSPLIKWICASVHNWIWLRELAVELEGEFHARYDHTRPHKAVDVIRTLSAPDIPHIPMTPFYQAMPPFLRHADSVHGYRNCYALGKFHLWGWKWQNRRPPWLHDHLREGLMISPKTFQNYAPALTYWKKLYPQDFLIIKGKNDERFRAVEKSA